MPSVLVLTLLILSSLAYYLGRRRAFSVAQGAIRKLHSLPVYYGLYTAIWCGLPALLIVATWLAFENALITQLVVAGLPDELHSVGTDHLNLLVNDIKNLVSGNIVSRQADANVQAAAARYQNLVNISHAAMAVVALTFAIAGGTLTLTRIKPEQRARNVVEA
ncbi:MAG: phosphate ABC transporter permease family protein, partial [Thiogranum sp.]